MTNQTNSPNQINSNDNRYIELGEWVATTVEGFASHAADVLAEEPDTCLHCLCDEWCEAHVTALMADAYRLGMGDPESAMDYVSERIRFQQVVANTLLPNLLVSLVEMHYPEDLETVPPATEK